MAARAWLFAKVFAPLCIVALLVEPTRARADEPWLLTLDGAAALPMTAPQSDEQGLGARLGVGVYHSLGPAFLFGLRLQGIVLTDGDSPSDPTLRDPGAAGFASGVLALRFRLPSTSRRAWKRGDGAWLDLAGGGGVTGSFVRPTFEIAAGWGIAAGSMDIAPVIRYMQVIQQSGQLRDQDARVLMLGLELTFLDDNEPPPPPEPPHPPRDNVEVQNTPGDRDGDGLLDAQDSCPDLPEDLDGFEDTDGCPDEDDDEDGIEDPQDHCPREAEDADHFQDEDGCPDPDNDRDGFLDGNDACPDQAEVINGIEDRDGCPDQGLIEMVDDRIVLEETVVFDFERSRVKSSARPVLQAIVELVRQHPEWTRLRVEGHTDIRGDATFNQTLSERRARNVMNSLVSLGIDASTIESVGYGSSRLRDTRDIPAAHERNRRVEFVVVGRRDDATGATQ